MSDTFDFVTVDLNDLTIEEIEAIESITGVAIDKAVGANQPKGKLMRALAYVSKRRENPDFTIEDAGKLKINLVSGDVPPFDATGS